MRSFSLFLPLATLSSALVIPKQEALDTLAEILSRAEASDSAELVVQGLQGQNEEPGIESWLGMAAAKNGYDARSDLASSLPWLEPDSEKSVRMLQDDEGDRDRDDDEPNDEDDDPDYEDDDPDYEDDDPDFERPPHHHPHRPPRYRPGPPRRCPPDMFCPEEHTIWELISNSRRTERLADIISGEDNIIDLLNDAKTNHTLFAPTNRGLGRFLDERPSPKSLRQIEHYQIIPGALPIGKMRRHQTFPTTLNLSSLGKDVPQRVVVSLHHDEIVLNGMTRVTTGDIVRDSLKPRPKRKHTNREKFAQNGIIHHIKHPLLPPPNTSTILHLLPVHFSTFTHSLHETKLTHHFWKQQRAGGTTFAPTNEAFERLGPRVNAFLFSAQGEQCLRSLLQYHLVLNRTLYSDAFYDAHGKKDEYGHHENGDAAVQVQLPTLLKKHKVSVDVARRGMDVMVRVNGLHRVVTLDLVAADGVVHVLDEVLIPPRRVGRKMNGTEEAEELTVEILKEKLGGCGERPGKKRMEL